MKGANRTDRWPLVDARPPTVQLTFTARALSERQQDTKLLAMHALAQRARPRSPVGSVRMLAAAAVTLVLAVMLGTTGPAGAAGTQDAGSGTSNISVVQTPSGAAGICLPPLVALRSATSSDASSFRLRITVAAPLCAPIDVTAAIYAMPGDGAAWPQELRETRGFVLSEPGVTEVIFTRDCTPVQFDVVTGPTPPVIAPWGEWHGPLLFPFDTSTAMQSDGCGPTPVVPEAPTALLLPVSAVVVAGGAGAVLVGRRRRAAG